MSYQFPPDIDALVQVQLASGAYRTADDVLRAALVQLATDDDEVSAIQASIDMLNCGERGRPLADVVNELRAKYDIPAEA
jgi:Arc/MetJ-type ribon-helix-helix transcriptional regulator